MSQMSDQKKKIGIKHQFFIQNIQNLTLLPLNLAFFGKFNIIIIIILNYYFKKTISLQDITTLLSVGSINGIFGWRRAFEY